jgi:hypothetical protein
MIGIPILGIQMPFRRRRLSRGLLLIRIGHLGPDL